jgi:hypothetical protein
VRSHFLSLARFALFGCVHLGSLAEVTDIIRSSGCTHSVGALKTVPLHGQTPVKMMKLQIGCYSFEATTLSSVFFTGFSSQLDIQLFASINAAILIETAVTGC